MVTVAPSETEKVGFHFKLPKNFYSDILLSCMIGDKEIKTTMRYHLAPVRVANINKSTNKCWRGCGEKEIKASKLERRKQNYHCLQMT